MDRDLQTDTVRDQSPGNRDRASLMFDMPDLMNGPQSTETENESGGWRGVNSPAGGQMPPATRPVGSRGGIPRD